MKTEYNIGIIEDDRFIGTSIAWKLNQSKKYNVQWFCCGEEMIRNGFQPDLLVLDYHLEDNGKEVMNGEEIASCFSDVPAIMTSAQEDMSKAISLMQSGIHDYIIKDVDLLERIFESVNDVVDTMDTNRKIDKLKKVRSKDLNRLVALVAGIAAMMMISFFV